MTHTPGPWRWQKLGGQWHLMAQMSGRPVVLTTLDGKLAVNDAGRCMLSPLTPEHPDAALLEAAPELAAALEELLAALPPFAVTARLVGARAKAREVLGRVKGE